MEGFSKEGMSAQAQQIWSMLDDMAENDPAAYRRFIERQVKEGKEQMAPPDPHMCVQVNLLQPRPPRPLFINFCSWKKIPEPKSPQEAVPVSGTPITEEKDEKGSFSLTSVAFNPKVLEEFGRNAKNPVDADTLIQLALDYIEHEQKVKVSRTYTVLPIDTPHKGQLELVRMTFSTALQKKSKGDSDFCEKDLNELEKTFGPLTTNEKESLLGQLSNLSGNANSKPGTDSQGKNNVGISFLSNSNDGLGDIKLNGIERQVNGGKKGLIEEIKEERLPAPKYSLEPAEDGDGVRVLELRVELPGVKSVADCELDISEDDVKLFVPGKFDMNAKLPSCIDDDAAKAKFSKKTSVLTLTMPIKS